MRKCQHNNCANPVFGTDKKTRLGYCKSHQYKRTDLDKRSISQKAMSKPSEKRLSNKIRTLVKENQIGYDQQFSKREEMEKWFDIVAKQIEKNPYCWNCGKFINKSFYRAASAHILPKRKTYGFPSVATHPLNFVVLGAGCGCHAKYDTCWGDASQMKIWPVAVERFKVIYPSIAIGEHKNLPDILKAFVSSFEEKCT